MLKRLFSASFVLVAALLLSQALPSAVDAQSGPPGGTIYAHDVEYQTVITPTDLPAKGKFNTLYAADGFAPVSDAAPGDGNYRGGRWEVRPITFVNIAPMQFTNADDVEAAAADGDIEIGDVVKRFVCPLVKK